MCILVVALVDFVLFLVEKVVHEGLGCRELGTDDTWNSQYFCHRFFLTYPTQILLLLYANCISRYEMTFWNNDA